jgi:hypothetical protein
MARKDPLDLAFRRVTVATVAFSEAADNLLTEAAVLETIAAQADADADYHRLRAAQARTEASTATQRATRIRELLG